MSILIKGMTLPRNCAECRLCDTCECLRDFRTYEEVLDAVEDGDLTRDQNCPLVEIPGTHGRLIDIDDAIESYGEKAELGYVLQAKFLNVIIEAEGER